MSGCELNKCPFWDGKKCNEPNDYINNNGDYVCGRREDAQQIGKDIIISYEPIHEWFGLSYAQYLVIPRTVLQSMPIKLQQRFVDCIEEMNELLPDWMPKKAGYYVKMKDSKGRYMHDPNADYQRGRRKLELPKKDS